MNKKIAGALVGWLKNTTLDSDKIAEHFGIRDAKTKGVVRELAAKLRKRDK